MSIHYKLVGILVLGFILSLAVSATEAEELTLKDGQKIIGTIVGYESDMFRVETEFGFALVRKDKVVSIRFGAGGSREPAQKRGDRQNTTATAKPAASNPGKAPESGAEAASGLAPVSRPLHEPLPPNLKEHLEGNNYVSDTFAFAMFKPPGWKIYEGAPRETGSAIVALGTEDEQTLLIVDRQVWSGAPDLKSDRAEANLRHTYQDYQKLFESPTELDGRPAIRRGFKGVLDGVEWHGVSVHVAHGNTLFGIIGLTSAETFQFQQAVLNKIINSFHFLTPSS